MHQTYSIYLKYINFFYFNIKKKFVIYHLFSISIHLELNDQSLTWH